MAQLIEHWIVVLATITTQVIPWSLADGRRQKFSTCSLGQLLRPIFAMPKLYFLKNRPLEEILYSFCSDSLPPARTRWVQSLLLSLWYPLFLRVLNLVHLGPKARMLTTVLCNAASPPFVLFHSLNHIWLSTKVKSMHHRNLTSLGALQKIHFTFSQVYTVTFVWIMALRVWKQRISPLWRV